MNRHLSSLVHSWEVFLNDPVKYLPLKNGFQEQEHSDASGREIEI